MGRTLTGTAVGGLVAADRPSPAVLVLTLNRPEKRNALNMALLSALADALDEAAADEAVRCVVLTAAGPVFCAGADIAEMAMGGVAVMSDPMRQRCWDAIAGFPKPLLAAVEGAALGAGNELVLLADIVVAGAEARFGQPEVAIGGMPGDGGTQRLVRAVGKNLAMKMILTGRPIDASTALAARLIAEMVPAGTAVDRAVVLASEIAAAAPLAVVAAKRSIVASFETTLSEGLAVEREAMWALMETADRAEGMTAFLEKRAPRFVGR